MRSRYLGTIYFVSDQSGNVKVGWTVYSPSNRVNAMQTGNAERLQLEATIEARVGEESDVHKYLKSCGLHVRGEWYRYDENFKEMVNAFFGEEVFATSEAF